MRKQETVRGGIIIPDSAKEKPQEGEVIAVGKGKINEDGKVFPLDVKAGDRILFGKYAGTEVKIDGEEFLIMKEDEVLGIIVGAAKSAERHEKAAASRQLTASAEPHSCKPTFSGRAAPTQNSTLNPTDTGETSNGKADRTR